MTWKRNAGENIESQILRINILREKSVEGDSCYIPPTPPFEPRLCGRFTPHIAKMVLGIPLTEWAPLFQNERFIIQQSQGQGKG
ncbi:MAG: hypothetical protein ABSC45_06695, partial [Desulfobaccales bacterium]